MNSAPSTPPRVRIILGNSNPPPVERRGLKRNMNPNAYETPLRSLRLRFEREICPPAPGRNVNGPAD